MLKLFKPWIFQGNLRKRNYFEGWYYKQVSANQDNVLSFIPGVSLVKKDQHAFIQVIDGVKGETWYFRYPLESFHYHSSEYLCKIGDSVFYRDGLTLNIDQDGHLVKGELSFTDPVEFPSTVFNPGIMGWYSFVPRMECKHGIVSVDHGIEGSLERDGKKVDFSGGRGYIEKDWGTSFPAEWLWLQCNNFENTRTSLMLSVARIPWMSSFFMGHICFLYTGGEFYRFASYNGSNIISIDQKMNSLRVTLERKNQKLEIEMELKKSGLLKAPAHGVMDRVIKESVDSSVSFRFQKGEDLPVLESRGVHAGLEVTENIVEMVKQDIRY
jgi:hypothetical protein